MHLIICKENEELRRTLNHLMRDIHAPITSFFPEHFSVDTFLQEVETYPFLSQKKTVVVHELQQLPEEGIKAICQYVEKPNEWIFLFLTATELAPQSKLAKLMEKQGQVHRIKEEKPWEKEKKLIQWIIDEAKREGMRLSLQAATTLVQGVDPQMLKSELDKLICFAYGRGEITLEDISLLSTPAHHETLWHLGDALLACMAGKALTIGKKLLEEGMAIFSLLASLRSQFSMGIEFLSSGAEAAKKFAYLKGNLFEKKMQTYKKYGKERLRQGMLLIFETELKAKNSSIDPMLLLELLTIKLTDDTLSTSQSIRIG